MTSDFYRRYAAWMLLAAALLFPLIGWGARMVFQRTDNSVSQWLPSEMDQTRQYDQFRRVFGSDEAVLVGWEGCTITDPRLELFATRVEEMISPGSTGTSSTGSSSTGSSSTATGAASVIQGVTTGQRVLNRLRRPPLELSRKTAIRRLARTLIGPDGQTTCAVVTLAPKSDADRRAAVFALQQLAVDHCRVDPQNVRLGGDASVSVGIGLESEHATTSLVWISGLVALIVAWACLRSVKLALMVCLLSQYCALMTDAIIYATGGSMNLLMIMVPLLVYVLTISAAVHLCNYYRDALRHDSATDAPAAALVAGWQPCLVATVTTAAGMASLCVSHVVPVKSFGFYAALNLLLSLGVLLLLLPAAMQRFPLAPRSGTPANQQQPPAAVIELVVRRRNAVIACFLCLAIILSVGLMQVQPSVDPFRFLPEQSRWRRDTTWFMDHLGPLAAIEIVVKFDNDCQLDLLERMRVVRDLHSNLGGVQRLESVISAATFAPPLGSSDKGRKGVGDLVQSAVLKRRLPEYRDQFVRQGYVGDDGDAELWRISARIRRFREVDYAEYLGRIEQRVEPVLDRHKLSRQHVQVIYTGAVPMFFSAQRELLQSLVLSFALALLLVTVVMMIVLRSVRAGAVSMLPNVFPALAIYGLMGWTGAVVDVGAMMSGSVALGIAVDDTLHFLTWFRRAAGGGATAVEAVRLAYQRCAGAMTQTTLIAGLALLVFTTASFQPVSQFGLLMFTLLVAALVGDVLLLPALLLTRAGKLFIPRPR